MEASTQRLAEPMRIAKAIAHAGLCSRRDAERWIGDGRVAVNGKMLTSAAHVVGPSDKIRVDGKPLPEAGIPRLWRYNKPKGLVTSHKDPQGRETVFDSLPTELPRVVSVGRLDFNTEGLLLLTTDGELARHLELPSTGWLRRYRVRAYGRVTEAGLERLATGITLDGVRYGPVEAKIDRAQGDNVWLNLGLREGKNREVKKLAEALGLTVNRLIRISFGPFALGDLRPGQVSEVKPRVLRDQLGTKLADALGLASEGERRRAARSR
ncbi:MAG: pseudouridine synthase [Methyloceanibacter sp.]